MNIRVEETGPNTLICETEHSDMIFTAGQSLTLMPLLQLYIHTY